MSMLTVLVGATAPAYGMVGVPMDAVGQRRAITAVDTEPGWMKGD